MYSSLQEAAESMKNLDKLRAARKRKGELNRIDAATAKVPIGRTVRDAKTGQKRALDIVLPPRKLFSATSYDMSAWLRRRMAPIRVAPVRILDAQGNEIGIVTTNPVSGARQRIDKTKKD